MQMQRTLTAQLNVLPLFPTTIFTFNSFTGSTSSLPAAVNNKNQGGINNANGARNDQEIFIWKAPPAPFVSRNDHQNGMPRRRTIQGGIDLDKVRFQIGT